MENNFDLSKEVDLDSALRMKINPSLMDVLNSGFHESDGLTVFKALNEEALEFKSTRFSSKTELEASCNKLHIGDYAEEATSGKARLAVGIAFGNALFK